jgi:hypothetical protein
MIWIIIIFEMVTIKKLPNNWIAVILKFLLNILVISNTGI